MSEYLIQDTTLIGIADKIRPLLGLTGTMTPEQMQTNLTTEQSNITAALAALTEKGVEVPEGANSNALAGLIEAIEAGGGTIIDTGSIVFATATSSTIVPIDIASKGYAWPDIVLFYSEDSSTVTVTSTSEDVGLAAGISVKKSQDSYNPTAYKKTVWDSYCYGFNIGVQKVLIPFVSLAHNVYLDNAAGSINLILSGANMSKKVGVSYRYYFIWLG